MANINNATGSKISGAILSAEFNTLVNDYIVSSSNTDDLFIGDLVKTNNTSIGGVPVVVKAASGETGRGFIVGIKSDEISNDLNYLPKETQRIVSICDDPNIEFEIQVNGILQSTDIGKNFNFINGAGNVITGLSGTQIDLTTATTGTAQVKILSLVQRKDNILGLYSKVRCKSMEHELSDSGGGGIIEHNALLNLAYDVAGHGTGYTGFQRGTSLDAVDPSPADDITKGYVAGDFWLNIGSNTLFSCLDNTIGAAVWDAIEQGVHWQAAVKDQISFVAAEPAGPSIYDRYINTATGVSSITAQSVTATYIYEWNGTSWTETIPLEGYAVWDETANEYLIYNGSAWVTLGATQSFLDLVDTPASYATAHAVYKVNSGTSAVVESTMTVDDSGNVTIPGKLTVVGLIDPTALILDPQATAPATDDGTIYYDSVLKEHRFREDGVWNNLNAPNLWEKTLNELEPVTPGDVLNLTNTQLITSTGGSTLFGSGKHLHFAPSGSGSFQINATQTGSTGRISINRSNSSFNCDIVLSTNTGAQWQFGLVPDGQDNENFVFHNSGTNTTPLKIIEATDTVEFLNAAFYASHPSSFALTDLADRQYVDEHESNAIWTLTGTEAALTTPSNTIEPGTPLHYTTHPTFLGDTDLVDKKFAEDLLIVLGKTDPFIVVDDGDTDFTLTQPVVANSFMFATVNGQFYANVYAFTASGTSFTWIDPDGFTLKAGDRLDVTYNYNLGSSIAPQYWQKIGPDLSPLLITDNVAIGKTAALAKLDVLGDAIISDTLAVASDTDTSVTLGRTIIFSRVSDYMTLAHFDNATATNYAFEQTNNGATAINAAAGQPISFRQANASKAFVDATGTFDFNLMPKVANISLNANGVLSLSIAEVAQLANIGATTISATQWGYLGAMNQGVATTNSVNFAGATLSGLLQASATSGFQFGGGQNVNTILTAGVTNNNKLLTQGYADANYSGGGGHLDQFNVYYVSKTGSDTLNDGKSIESPFLTISKAIAIINGLSPSFTNRFKIEIIGGGIYLESNTMPLHCQIVGLGAAIEGTTTIGDWSSIEINKHIGTILKTTPGRSWARITENLSKGPASPGSEGIIKSTNGILYVKAGSMDNGTLNEAILADSGATIYFESTDLDNSNTPPGIVAKNSSTVYANLDRLLCSDGIAKGIFVETGSTVYATIKDVNCLGEAYEVDSSTLYLSSESITGQRTDTNNSTIYITSKALSGVQSTDLTSTVVLDISGQKVFGEATLTADLPDFVGDNASSTKTVPWDNTTEDIGGNFVTAVGADQGKYIIPYNGDYHANIRLQLEDLTSSHTQLLCNLQIDDASDVSVATHQLKRCNAANERDSTNQLNFVLHDVLRVFAGYKVYVQIGVFNGAKVVDIESTSSHFSVELMKSL